MLRRLQSNSTRLRDQAVNELIAIAPSVKAYMLRMTPDERLRWIQTRLEMLIAVTPTSEARNAMTEANICVMSAIAK